MKLTRAKKVVIGLFAFCVVCVLGIFAIYHYRKIPLSEILNPGYWLRQMNGRGEYDPTQAILYRGNPNLKEIALTIDDGPHELYGPEVLDVLRQYQVPATFFVVGVRVKACPDLVRRMVLEGHEIGNHTYDHQRLNTLKPHAIANELRFNDVNIFEAAGVHTSFMRPPGVRYDNQVLDVSKSLGYVTVSWTNAAKDYLNQSPDYIVRSVVDRTENGSIILLHQDNPYTAEALPRIITALKAKGYKFVTISTMLAHLKVEPYASQQKLADASANGQPFVLANGRTVLTGAPVGGPQISSYIPPLDEPVRAPVAPEVHRPEIRPAPHPAAIGGGAAIVPPPTGPPTLQSATTPVPAAPANPPAPGPTPAAPTAPSAAPTAQVTPSPPPSTESSAPPSTAPKEPVQPAPNAPPSSATAPRHTGPRS